MLDAPTPPSESSGSAKKFWNKPEGKFAMACNIAIAAVVFWFWGSIVPFLLGTVENTLFLILYAIAVLAVLYLLFDKSFRRFIWYLYRAGMRALTSMFVNMDPIGVLKTILENAKSKKEEFEETVAEIRGQRVKLDRSLSTNTQQFEESMNKLNLAKRQKADADPVKRRNAERVDVLESKQAERLERRIKRQTEHMKRYDFVVQVLTRYREVCEDTILDISREIEDRQQDRDQSTSFSKGMKAAFGILRGSPEDMEMQDMAIETLERDYAQRMGEVENILDITKNVVIQADFNDDAAMEKAAHLLDNWKHKDSDVPLDKKGTTKASVVADEEGTGSPVNKDSNYF